MNKIIFVILLINTAFVSAQNKSFDYAYENRKGVCVYSIADRAEYPVAKDGSDPCLSPNGKMLAYTLTTKDGSRYIQLMDLNTKVKTTLNTFSNNCYGPIWSPDGKSIAYNVFDVNHASDWSIAVISANTRPYIVANKTYAAQWMPNGMAIDVQDLDKLYVVALNGNLMATYNIAKLGHGIPELSGDGGASSSDIFIFTPHGRKIIFSSGTNEIGDGDGPPSAIFVYDTTNGKTMRLSPKGYSATRPFLKGGQVLFDMAKFKSNITNVYAIGIDGKNMKLLLPNASFISAKN